MGMRFVKMHSLGNDFVVLDGVRGTVEPTAPMVRRLADRRRGVGCDQVLVVQPASHLGADYRYRIFNADGEEVEHCGNGVRCLARFIHDAGLSGARRLRVETQGGRLTEITLEADGSVAVDMGPPELEPARIPFRAQHRRSRYPLRTSRGELRIAAVSMGNPHAVLEVDDVDHAPVELLGPEIERHSRFPARVNVGFMQRLGPGRIRLRVFERGVGETPACGTGACAAVVAGRLTEELDPSVAVELPGGELMVHWPGEGRSVWMSGPATTVFRGEMDDP